MIFIKAPVENMFRLRFFRENVEVGEGGNSMEERRGKKNLIDANQTNQMDIE